MKSIMIGCGLLSLCFFAHAKSNTNFPLDKDLKDSIIKVNYIDPFEKAAAEKNAEPEWTVLKGQISAKYDTATAGRLTTLAKVYYYFNKKDYPQFTAALVQHTSKYVGPDELDRLNRNAYMISALSANHDELKAALGWSKHTLVKDPGNADYQKTFDALTAKLASQ
jgi:hypothetical protein